MKFFSRYTQLIVQLDLIKIFALLMILVNMLFGILFFVQGNQVKTVIVPPNITGQFEIVGNRLDNKYFEQVGKYLTQAILTISPNTMDSAFIAIEAFIAKDPEVIAATKAYFLEQNQFIKDNNVYQAFYPLQTAVNFEQGKFSVTGMLRRNTGNVFVSDERKVVDFDFRIKDGRLLIKSFGVR